MGMNGLKVQTAVLVQLQRALQDPSRGIRDISRETIGHHLKKYKNLYFLTTNAHLSQASRIV